MSYKNKCYIKRFCSLAISLLILFNNINFCFAEEYEIYIDSVKSLIQFSENCVDESYSENKYFILSEDIDLTNNEFPPIPIFSGTFDGNGHTIRGFNLEGKHSSSGFFRYISKGAVIKNLSIEAIIEPTGMKSTLGILSAYNEGTISNCTVDGYINGSADIGGITGINKSTGIIINSINYSEVIGESHVGGIAGKNEGIISNSSNEGKINQHNENTFTDVGGIAGWSSGTIENSTNRNRVGYKHNGYNIGGIAGLHGGIITNCSNEANVFGRKDIGGIAGQFDPNITFEYGTRMFDEVFDELSFFTDIMKDLSKHMNSNTAENIDTIKILIDYIADLGETVNDAGTDISKRIVDAVNETHTLFLETNNELEKLLKYIDDYTVESSNEMGELTKATRNMRGSIIEGFNNIDMNIKESKEEIGPKLDNIENELNDIKSETGNTIDEITDEFDRAGEAIKNRKEQSNNITRNNYTNYTALNANNNVSLLLNNNIEQPLYQPFFNNDYYYGPMQKVAYTGNMDILNIDKDIKIDLENIIDIDDIMNEIRKMLNDLINEMIDDIINEIINNIDIKDIQDALEEIISEILKNIEDIRDIDIGKLIDDIIKEITDNIDIDIEDIRDNLEKIISNILKNIEDIRDIDIEKLVNEIIEKIIEEIMNNIDIDIVGMRDKLEKIISNILKNIENIKDLDVEKVINEIIKIIIDSIDLENINMDAIFDKVKDNIDDMIYDIIKDLEDVVDDIISDIMDDIMRDIKNLVEDILGDVGYLADDIIGDINGIISDVIKNINDKSQKVQDTVKDIEKEIDDAKSKINSAQIQLKEAEKRAREIANDINMTIEEKRREINNVIKAIEDIDINITDNINNIENSFSNINDDIKSIRVSISTVYDDVSDNIFYLLEDIDNYAKDIEDTIERMLNHTRKLTTSSAESLGNINSKIVSISEVFNKFVNESGKHLDSTSSNLNDQVGLIHNQLDLMGDSLVSSNNEINKITSRLIEQLDRIQNTFADVESPEFSIDDISDTQYNDSFLGQIAFSTNKGDIYGDINIGGIAGNVSREFYDDPEEEWNITENLLVSTTALIRATIFGSKNSGNIIAKNNNAGGIIGQSKVGSVIKCINSGDIETTSGDYCGGIAGTSQNVIKDSYSMTSLTGNSYIGGIAGFGKDIQRCYSMTSIHGEGEKLGTIAGDVDKEGKVSENYFLRESLGGIDGINSKNVTTSMSFEEFSNINGLPEEFLDFKVTFVADDKIIDVVDTVYGGYIMENQIPKCPEKDGYFSVWSEFDPYNITRNIKVEAEYTLFTKVISTGETQPILLIEGSFSPEASVSVTELEYEISSDFHDIFSDYKVISCYSFQISNNLNDDQSYKIRIKTDNEADAIAIIYEDSIELVDCVRDGSYLVFSMHGENSFIVLSDETEIPMPYKVAITATSSIIVIMIGSKFKNRRSKESDTLQ